MNTPKIPTLCVCGCGEVVWNGNLFIHGHSRTGKLPWNKNKKGCFSEDTIKKMSDAKKHQTLSEEQKQKISNTLKGKKKPLFTEEHKKHIRDAAKGRKWSKEQRYKMGLARQKLVQSGWKLPDHVRQKASEALRGEKHPLWNGGTSFLPYCSKFNHKLKETIRERDNRTCQLCGVNENGKKLDVHHIHYDKPNCNPDLIALCRNCHAKINSNRDYYESLFIENLKQRKANS